jgi:hypothetical protein
VSFSPHVFIQNESNLELSMRAAELTSPSCNCAGFLLLARVVAVTFCVTLAASMAARHGPTTMAAFQICSQVWLATSLLADGLAVAGQVILAALVALLHGKRITMPMPA